MTTTSGEQKTTGKAEFKPGMKIVFGKEKTLWRVLEIGQKKEVALLFADKPVCDRAYNNSWENTTWERCELRAWLNGEYYENAFTADEKAAIMECVLINPDNPKYGTNGGADTKDRIFLLDLEEAEKYFCGAEDRASEGWWWLRSPGNHNFSTAGVLIDGSISFRGAFPGVRNCVRPAMRIDLKTTVCILK